jgi:diaminopimelate epimerase
MTGNIIVLFSKMQGLGNDYIVINETEEEVIPEKKKPEIVDQLCRRGFSIGADGVIFVASSDVADIRFRIFNSDGSEAEMCGNGIRCFAKFVYENNILKDERMHVETLAGIKEVVTNVENNRVVSSKVNMGTANFNTAKIPMNTEKKEFIDEKLLINGKTISITAMSIGNPHAVIFTKHLNEIALDDLGPRIENHEAFPERINVHFVTIINPNEIDMITWERGAGFTLACGTGATSSVIVGYKLALLDKEVIVHLPGGDLIISIYEKEGKIGAMMEGNASLVFDGIIEVKL